MTGALLAANELGSRGLAIGLEPAAPTVLWSKGDELAARPLLPPVSGDIEESCSPEESTR